MKKIIFCAFSAAIIFVACSPKVAPTATPANIPSASAVSQNDAYINAGQAIFTTTCTKCHAAKTNYVSKHTYAENMPVLSSMVKKAKLSPEQIQQVSTYVNSIAKK